MEDAFIAMAHQNSLTLGSVYAYMQKKMRYWRLVENGWEQAACYIVTRE